MQLLLIWSVWLLTVLAFYFGYVLGKGEEKPKVKIPNPIKAYTEHKQQKEEESETQRELEKMEIIRKNIDNYDGTSKGQKDIPR